MNPMERIDIFLNITSDSIGSVSLKSRSHFPIEVGSTTAARLSVESYGEKVAQLATGESLFKSLEIILLLWAIIIDWVGIKVISKRTKCRTEGERIT